MANPSSQNTNRQSPENAPESTPKNPGASSHTSTDPRRPWQIKLHGIIFEAETAVGRAFDIGLMIAIFTSISVVMLDSVPSIRAKHRQTLLLAEYAFTLLFTVEYLLRLSCVRHKRAYAFSLSLIHI